MLFRSELMKNAKNRVKIHTPYIICNDMMYNTWEEIAENVSDFSITVSYTHLDVYKRQECMGWIQNYRLTEFKVPRNK